MPSSLPHGWEASIFVRHQNMPCAICWQGQPPDWGHWTLRDAAGTAVGSVHGVAPKATLHAVKVRHSCTGLTPARSCQVVHLLHLASPGSSQTQPLQKCDLPRQGLKSRLHTGAACMPCTVEAPIEYMQQLQPVQKMRHVCQTNSLYNW
jgi:hypothetical protein